MIVGALSWLISSAVTSISAPSGPRVREVPRGCGRDGSVAVVVVASALVAVATACSLGGST
jgi:hypothetical protein